MQWGSPPAEWSCCFIGLGNEVYNRWDWFTDADISGGLLTLVELAPYLDGEGRLVLAVLMTGTESCTLGWLRWGGNVGPVAGLEADPESGSAPLAVSFDAGSSYDPDSTLADFEWDLDGDGEFNETGPEADSRGSVKSNFTYNDAGGYTPAIRVTDDDGAQDTAAQDVSVGGWMIVTAAEWGGYTTDLAVIDGCPAICYLAGSAMDKGLFYIRANTPTGTNEADWSEPVTVDPAVAYYGSLNLLEIAGNPAISYLDSENHPRYRRSTTTTGASEEDWSQVAAFANSPYNCSMAIVDGNPALSWGAGWELYYARATTPEGANASEWHAPILIENGG